MNSRTGQDWLAPVLDALADAVNVAIQFDLEAPERLQALAYRPLGVRVHGFDLHVTVVAEPGRIRLTRDAMPEPVVSIAGPPASLIALKTRAGTSVLFSGALDITGDVTAARAWKRLFDRLDPDWEEALAQVTGDIPAHEAGRMARAFGRWTHRAGEGRVADLRAWLIDELEIVPTRREVSAWMQDVDRLRADADRLHARLARAAARAQARKP